VNGVHRPRTRMLWRYGVECGRTGVFLPHPHVPGRPHPDFTFGDFGTDREVAPRTTTLTQVAGYRGIASMTADRGRRTTEKRSIPRSAVRGRRSSRVTVRRLLETGVVGRNLSYLGPAGPPNPKSGTAGRSTMPPQADSRSCVHTSIPPLVHTRERKRALPHILHHRLPKLAAFEQLGVFQVALKVVRHALLLNGL
jgi:hypothetical protein